MTRSSYHPHPHLRLFLLLGGVGLVVVTILATIAVVRFPAVSSATIPVEIREYSSFTGDVTGDAKTVFEVWEVPAAVLPDSAGEIELPAGATLRASWFQDRGRDELNAVVRRSLSGYSEPIPIVPEGLGVLPGRYEFVLGVVSDGQLTLVLAHVWIEVRLKDG